MKVRNIIMLMLLTCNMAALAATKVFINDFTITAGSEAEITISLNTDMTDIDLVEGEIAFPAQLIVVDDAYGTNARVKVADDRASGFMGNYNPSNKKFSMQSTGSTLSTGNGVIAYMKVKAATNISVSSTVTLSNFKIRHKGGNYENITSANAAVTGQAAPSATVSLACAPTVLNLEPNTTGTVELKVQTTGNITGLQGVLTFDNGITIKNVAKGEAAGNPVIFNYNADNGNFVYFGSMDNVSGTLLTLEIETTSDFSDSGTITLSDIVATDASSVRISVSDVTLEVSNNTTGINGIAIDAADSEPTYNLSGQKVNGSYKGIVIRNGKKVVVK